VSVFVEVLSRQRGAALPELQLQPESDYEDLDRARLWHRTGCAQDV